MTEPQPTAPDYSHRFHAGNTGDVWKHTVLLAALDALRAEVQGPIHYVETHAGEGRYALATTGEWTEGVGKILATLPEDAAPAAVRYRDAIAMAAGLGPHPGVYPGSPLLAGSALRQGDTVTLYERDEAAFAALTQEIARADLAPQVAVHHADGLEALADPRWPHPHTLVLVDPPYAGKPEWAAVTQAFVAGAKAAEHTSFLLWYPIKSLTRPNAMLARIRDAGIPATAVELLTTPLELKRNRLNGSGMLLIRPAPHTLAHIHAALPALAAACATHEGRWSTRTVAWGSASAAP
jgi:23S rRNA (adenine2030-N6)-methyltransferase